MATATDRSILLISGSTREASTNTAVLRTVAEEIPSAWSAIIYAGLAQLPHFNPDVELSEPPSSVQQLRRTIDASAALLISTPEYAGAMPGALKNLLEWTIGDTVMSGKPVGYINPSTAPQRAAGTYDSLRTVLAYTGAALVGNACVDVPVPRSSIDDCGTISDPTIREQIHTAAIALTSAAGH